MRRTIVTIAILFSFRAEAAPTAAAKPMAVCVNSATGVVTARPKCKAGEAPLNLASVAATTVGPQGAQGPKGDQGAPGILNVATCYKKVGEWQLTNDGVNYADAECNSVTGEFMLSDGIDYQPFVDIVTRERTPITKDGDTVPTGISVSTLSPSKVYQLRAFITCCKR